jgi:hypothetical protein
LIIVVHATESVSVTRIKSKGKRNNYTNTSTLLASVFKISHFQFADSISVSRIRTKAKEIIVNLNSIAVAFCRCTLLALQLQFPDAPIK